MENRRKRGRAIAVRGTADVAWCVLVMLGLIAASDRVALAGPKRTPTAGAHAATQTPHIPQGFGKAKFGISLEQARALYPSLTKAGATGAAYFRSPNLTRYWMPKIKIPGMKEDCSVEFRFWKDKLWSIIIYYGANPTAEVMEGLAREYGPPTVRSSDPSWTLGTVTIITSPAQMWYSLDEGEIGKDVRREFMEALQRQNQRKAVPSNTPVAAAPSPPGATPPAPSTPAAPPP